jgi:hypothetical protein
MQKIQPIAWDEIYIADRKKAFIAINDRNYFYDFEFADIFVTAQLHGDKELVRAVVQEAINREVADKLFDSVLKIKSARRQYHETEN